VTIRKSLLIISILGVGAITAGVACRIHLTKVRAARLEQVVPPAPYFPSGAIWTKDGSHAPLDPDSAVMIATLAEAGGWGHGRMQVDFSMRVLKADANTPLVPFRNRSGAFIADSDPRRSPKSGHTLSPQNRP
jgi:hypothetical protein